MRFAFALLMMLLSCSAGALYAQSPDTLWTRTYGGADIEYGYSVQQTSDGGFIVAGYTESFGEGEADVYLIKAAASGDTIWTRTYGGPGGDIGRSVQQTTDAGYIIAGDSRSFSNGIPNVYLIKTNASGDTIWTRTYAGEGVAAAWSVQQTSDDGYVVAGETKPLGDGAVYDVYLIKTNASGDTLWTRTFGGEALDAGVSVRQTFDGGYIMAGYTESFGAGGDDVYLVRTDSSGDSLWTRTFGGENGDIGVSVQQTFDGGYIIAGVTFSFGEGSCDVYVIKTDADGDTLWTRTYGGTDWDWGTSIQQATDSGHILSGHTASFGQGNRDLYVVRIDPSGDTLWTTTYGGEEDDYGISVQQTVDGGYIVGGITRSFGEGEADVYLVRLAADQTAVEDNHVWPDVFSLNQNYPNPFNSSTVISFTLPEARHVTFTVHDLLGRRVETLIHGEQPAGHHQVVWDASDHPSGIYFYRIQAGKHHETRKMLFIK